MLFHIKQALVAHQSNLFLTTSGIKTLKAANLMQHGASVTNQEGEHFEQQQTSSHHCQREGADYIHAVHLIKFT